MLLLVFLVAGVYRHQTVVCLQIAWLIYTCVCDFPDMLVIADKPLVPGIAHLYLADRVKHDELAAEWTIRFAR